MSIIPKLFFYLSIILGILSCNNESSVSEKKQKVKVDEQKIIAEIKKKESKMFWFEKNAEGKFDIVFSKKMKNVLELQNPNFKLYTYPDFVKTCGGLEATYFQNPNPPFATIGDFNLDGMDDLALMGYEKAKTIFMAILSNSKDSSFTFQKIIEFDLMDPKKEFLDEESNKGLYVYICTQKRNGNINGKMQEVDQVIIEHCGKASQGFYFAGTTLKSIIVSD